MTRREWSELAAVIKDELTAWPQSTPQGNAIKLVAMRIAGVLSGNHSRFSPERFLRECGIDHELPPG
jgi:hypothetical protein